MHIRVADVADILMGDDEREREKARERGIVIYYLLPAGTLIEATMTFSTSAACCMPCKRNTARLILASFSGMHKRSFGISYSTWNVVDLVVSTPKAWGGGGRHTKSGKEIRYTCWRVKVCILCLRVCMAAACIICVCAHRHQLRRVHM